MMTRFRPLRAAVPAALAALALAATPVMALEPSVEVVDLGLVTGHSTDLASRGSVVVMTADITLGSSRRVFVAWSTDAGATPGWPTDTIVSPMEATPRVTGGRLRRARVAACAVLVDATTRRIETHTNALGSSIEGQRAWTGDGDVCAGRTWHAWPTSGSPWPGSKSTTATRWCWRRVRSPVTTLSPQRFSLGRGTPGRNLSVRRHARACLRDVVRQGTLKVRQFQGRQQLGAHAHQPRHDHRQHPGGTTPRSPPMARGSCSPTPRAPT
ncbi:MAG: hypothetical protein R3C32_03230 [Chloroflexota bacterium]